MVTIYMIVSKVISYVKAYRGTVLLFREYVLLKCSAIMSTSNAKEWRH